MTILTMANSNFINYAQTLRNKAESIGYNVIIHQVSDSFIPKKDNKKYVAKSPFKPSIIRERMDSMKDFMLYMDADAYLKSNVDDLSGDWDVVITVHPTDNRREHKYANIIAYLNAGVIGFNNTDNAKRFVDMWIAELENTTTGSDQEALTSLVARTGTDWKSDQIVDLNGIKVKLVDSLIYNFTFWGEKDQSKARILHYVGAWKQHYPG